MAQNQFLRFAFSGASLNLLTDAQYHVDNMRYVGNERGVARRKLVNKVLKQSASMSYAIGEAVVYASSLDIADDNEGLQNLIDYLKRVFLPPYTLGDANKFVVVNSTGDGIVYRTINYANENEAGIIMLATYQDVTTATNTLKSVTPGVLLKAKANGVCPLGANTKVPSQYLPSVDDGIPGLVEGANITEVNAGNIINKFVSPGTLLKNKAGGVCPLDASIKIPIANLYTDVVNGVPILDSSGLVKNAELPKAAVNTQGILYLASESEVATGTETSKAITPYTLLKGKANGVCPLGSDGKFLIGYHPNSGVSASTYARVSVNATGHVTSGDNNLNADWLTSGTFPIARHPGSGVNAGTYGVVYVNSYGHVTSGTAFSAVTMRPYTNGFYWVNCRYTWWTAPANGYVIVPVNGDDSGRNIYLCNPNGEQVSFHNTGYNHYGMWMTFPVSAGTSVQTESRDWASGLFIPTN